MHLPLVIRSRSWSVSIVYVIPISSLRPVFILCSSKSSSSNRKSSNQNPEIYIHKLLCWSVCPLHEHMSLLLSAPITTSGPISLNNDIILMMIVNVRSIQIQLKLLIRKLKSHTSTDLILSRILFLIFAVQYT